MSADQINAKVASLERAVKAARAVQARQVMPLIGPLLDAWDDLSNDAKEQMREEAPTLCEYLDKIDEAMEADIGRLGTESASTHDVSGGTK